MESDDSLEEPVAESRSTGGVRLSSLVVGMILGTIVALIGAVALLIVVLRDPTPILTQEAFEAAERRWEQNGPASYNLDLVLSGRQRGRIHVEVREGMVTAMTRDGRKTAPHTWEYWSVPGLLEIIRHDLEGVENPAEGFGVPRGSQVIQRARFDPEYGYPVHYRRTILGTELEIEWEIVRFEPVR